MQKAAARFLLILKEQHRLTQVAINYLVSQVNSGVHCQRCETGVESAAWKFICDDLQCFSQCYENTNPFMGLETEYRQKKFYKNHFNLVLSIIVYTYDHTHNMMFFNVKQEPVTVKLGDTGDIRVWGRYISVCPTTLLPGLSSLLQNPYVFEVVAIKNSTSLCTNLGIQINLIDCRCTSPIREMITFWHLWWWAFWNSWALPVISRCIGTDNILMKLSPAMFLVHKLAFTNWVLN